MLSKRGHGSHDFELNLTPVIDCFVTLICFLLLSATYVNLVGMEAKVPIAVPASAAATTDQSKFKLELDVRANGMNLIASGAGTASGKRWIAHVAGKPDYAGLHSVLLKIKAERPKEFSIYFNADIDMSYEELVRLMDTSRNLALGEGPFDITDERNGKPVKTDTLFPDFVIANLASMAARRSP